MPVIRKVVNTNKSINSKTLSSSDKNIASKLTNESTYRLDIDINMNNTKEYLLSSNAVELMPRISEYDGYISLTTKTTSNFELNDKVYIIALSGETGVEYSDTTYVMDNIIEASGCTDWYYHPYIKGYKIIFIDHSKNNIVINRKYENKFDDKILMNHYITKLYVGEQDIVEGNFDGVVYKNVNINTDKNPDAYLNMIQSIILSGETNFMDFNDKYDSDYVSVNISDDYKNYLSKNNNKYGFTIVKNQIISGSTIYNGYYYDCVIKDSVIEEGFFSNCNIIDSTVNNGKYSGSTIDITTTWNYGLWYDGTFNASVWNDGIWNIGTFDGKTWNKGIFNDGDFINSDWLNGYFNGGTFNNSNWSGGTFTNSTFRNSNWYDGKFNGDTFIESKWYDGKFINGTISYSTWYGGDFINGLLNENTIWVDGNFYDGKFERSTWSGGTFYDGYMNECTWIDGTFNDGIIMKTNWYNGTFNNGTMNGLNSGLTFNSAISTPTGYDYIWYDGVFNSGTIENMYWVRGTFNNGIVNNSIMLTVDWNDGIFNGNVLGPYNYDLSTDDLNIVNSGKVTINWKDGTFNKGQFGLPYEQMDGIKMESNWSGGTFYYGSFHQFTGTTNTSDATGGFYDGVFRNGSFYGIFYGRSFIRGNFVSPPASWESSKSRPVFVVKINNQPQDIW